MPGMSCGGWPTSTERYNPNNQGPLTTVAVAVERVAADVASAVVEVLTLDVADISALAAHVPVRMDVVSL